jgi:hypothetical protein
VWAICGTSGFLPSRWTWREFCDALYKNVFNVLLYEARNQRLWQAGAKRPVRERRTILHAKGVVKVTEDLDVVGAVKWIGSNRP